MTVVIWFSAVGCRMMPPRFAPGKLYAPTEIPVTKVESIKMVRMFKINDTRPIVMKFSGIKISENIGLIMMPTRKKAIIIIRMFFGSPPSRIVGTSEYAKYRDRKTIISLRR
jgi:hypothetical protein